MYAYFVNASAYFINVRAYFVNGGSMSELVLAICVNAGGVSVNAGLYFISILAL
jgi:hypothetical protein